MKKHLFYTFLILFIATAVITLAGITRLIPIDEFYLKGLFGSLILELCGAVIFMYRKADFFDDTPKSNPRPVPQNVMENEKVCHAKDLDQKISNIEDTTPTSITVNEVIESINSAPPFQKKEVSEKYVGLVFESVGYLTKIDTDWNDKSKVRVNMLLEKGSIAGNSIWFSTKLDEHPELKVLTKDSAIKVKGKLLSASGEGLSITLQPIKIEILGTRSVA
ncbi:hypothetical protein M2G96_12305 [Vibrio vulnificus]|nr:hypothetical protein [Vibrio vulnificus]ELF6474249.1 hypothetical protein [Vibrio vulnificus]MCU8215045.1 hypothetical protein [Vibrio vulnificus]HAS8434385.1 hypothetical protein [Vibrio vulnificus]